MSLLGHPLYDRLLQVKRAAGAPGETHMAFSYPNLTTVVSKQDQAALDDGAVVTNILYDGLERKIDTQRKLGSCTLDVKQTYDGKGRPHITSLPYNTCGEAAHYQTTTYDAANRVVSVATEDGAATTTAYNGNQTTVADASGAARTLTTDGLGRLGSVVEDPTGRNYLTSYTYNLLDDLLSVRQGSLQRSFTYDAMKRLVTATNPETNTICYGTYSGSTCTANYDGNGNLLSRVDAKGVTTSYTYDGLNRLQTKSYSDGTTATVTLSYDDGTGAGSCPGAVTQHNLGRLTGVRTAAVAGLPVTVEATSYDALGRACASAETVGTASPYGFGYQYNLAGGLTTETYPSGRVVNTGYDGLNRPNGVSSGTTTYVNGANTSYASNDALAQLQFGPAGTPVATETFTYDPVRRQPTAIAVSNGAGSQLSLSYGYCPAGNCTKNNGNVQTAGVVVPGMVNATQTFGYDGVNRLTSAVETGGSSEWDQCYDHDQWGNHIVVPGTTATCTTASYIPNPYATPTALTQYTNNQWMGSGAAYDPNGNLTALPLRGYTYDGENRLVGTTQPNMPAIGYVYDGSGRRVQKTVGTAVTTYVYDGGGELTAEYSTAAATASGTEYLVADVLGSTRLVLGSTGTVTERLDYLPFGEEIPAGVGGRPAPYSTGSYPSNPDIESQKFTGKERDAETGLDFFGNTGTDGTFSCR